MTAAEAMPQMVFLIDLPRLNEVHRSVNEARQRLTFFGQELLYFLEAMGLDRDVIDGVVRFDFSATEGLAFVHTMYTSSTISALSPKF